VSRATFAPVMAAIVMMAAAVASMFGDQPGPLIA
jgi:hypothetical protein